MPAQRFLAGMPRGQRVDAPRGLFPTKAQGVLTVPFSALPRGMRLGKLATKFEQMLNLCDPQAIAPSEPSYTPRLFPEPRDAAPVKKTPCKGLALAQSAALNNQEAEFEAMLLPDSIASASMLEAPSKVLHHASKFEDHSSKTSRFSFEMKDQDLPLTASSFTQADIISAFQRQTSSPVPCHRAPTPQTSELTEGEAGVRRGGKAVSPLLPSLAKFGSQQEKPPKEDSGAVTMLQEDQELAQTDLIRDKVEELDSVQNLPVEQVLASDRFEEDTVAASRWSSKATSRKSTKEVFGHASTPSPLNEEVAASRMMERYIQEMNMNANTGSTAAGWTGHRSQSARGDRPKQELNSAARPWDDAPKGTPERPPPLPSWPQRRCNPAMLPRASKRCGSPPAETIEVSPTPSHLIRRPQRTRGKSGARFSAGRRRRNNESPVLEINPNGILDFPSYAIPRYYSDAVKAANAAYAAKCSRSPSPSDYCRDAMNGEHHEERQRPRFVNETSTSSTYLPTTPTNSKPSSPQSGATPTDPLRTSPLPEREPPSPPSSPRRNLEPGSPQPEIKLPGGAFMMGNQGRHRNSGASVIRPPTPGTPTSPGGRQTPDSPAYARPTSPWEADGELDNSRASSPWRPCETVSIVDSQDQKLARNLLGRQHASRIRTNTLENFRTNTLEDFQPMFGRGLASPPGNERVDSNTDPCWTNAAVSVDDMMCAPSVAELASQRGVDDELLNASVGSILQKSSADSRLWDSSEDVDSLAEAYLGKKEAELVD
eukprot:TRINITY_DN29624_c0_g1_i1.p1 TRINITY_DN29624_c0_g1~~TRINITY_DN29624_c0_g1_i1.p1  ORF type:complete len:769 (-),score=108.62 TRINITY_DN29624_c0_g1_i1:463-2769(-)